MKRGFMMLISKRRFEAFFLIAFILISLILTFPSQASSSSDEDDSSISGSQRSNYSEEQSIEEESRFIIDLNAGHANGIGASSPKTPQRPPIAGKRSTDRGIKEIESSSKPSQGLRQRKPTEKPTEMFELRQDRHFQSAMYFYDPNDPQVSETFNWDSQRIFMGETDARIFDTSRLKRSLAIGTLGFLIGGVSSFPSTGALVKTIGEFFHIRPGTGLTIAIQSWTVSTTFPSFAMDLGEGFYLISDTLFKKEEFPTRSDENISKPCVIKINLAHKTAISALVFASFLDAVGNLGVIELAYFEHFQDVFYGTGWAYTLSWMKRSYTIGRAHIDRLFCKYADSDYSRDQRRLLVTSLHQCRQAIAQSDAFTKELYDHILEELGREQLIIEDLEADSSHLFALSALFLQSAGTMPYTADEDSSLIASTRFLNYQINKDIPIDWKEEFIEKLSLVFAAAGSVGRIVAMQYILDELLTNILHVPAPAANTVAWVFSCADVIFKSFAERDVQQQYMKGWLNSFSVQYLGDFQWLRKITGWSSIINGNLFALAKTVAGITSFNAWGAPIPLQIICLAPAFVLDQAAYGDFFDKGKNKFITNLATMRQPTKNAPISIKRAWLMKWIEKIEYPLTSQWDSDTIGNLAAVILRT